LISGFVSPALALDGFTQADRERLEAVQTAFMQQVDKRFGQTSDMFYALAAIIWCFGSSGALVTVLTTSQDGTVKMPTLFTIGDCARTEHNERLPGSSEVIESIFGKLKYLEKSQSTNGFTGLIV